MLTVVLVEIHRIIGHDEDSKVATPIFGFGTGLSYLELVGVGSEGYIDVMSVA